MARSVRVATLNVHAWRDANRKPNFDRLLAWLHPLQLDILALQEVAENARDAHNKRSRTFELSAKLGMPHHVIVQDVAVLSRWPIRHCTLVPRDGSLPEPQDPATLFQGDRAQHSRRLVVAEVEVDGCRPIQVACVHFDYKNEPHRFGQWAELRGVLNVLPPGPRLLVGDMNALTRSDYDTAEWRHIQEVRERNNWESPTSELTDALRMDGWVDLWQVARGDGSTGGASMLGDRSTCRFDTRIDYVFADPRFRESWALQSVEHRATDATDHALVLVELSHAGQAQAGYDALRQVREGRQQGQQGDGDAVLPDENG